MAIAFGSSGTGASGTGSANPTTPTATVDGDIMIAHTVSKYALPDAPPTGWTLIGTVSGGHGSSGSNTGTVYVAFYYKIAASDANSTAYTWTVTGGNSIRANISRYTKAEGDQWVAPAFASVANGTPTTSWSATASSNPGISSGDIIVIGAGVNSSAYSYSAPALSATGCTFGTVTNRFANQVNTGDHLEPVMYDAACTAGPSSAAPVFTMTVSSSAIDAPAGATAFVRLRASTTAVVKYVNGGAFGSGGTTSVTVTYPSSISSGNVLMLALVGKYPTNYPTTPSGWTLLLIQRSSSGLGNASNSGDVWVATYFKIANGTETGTFSVTVTSGNVCAAAILNYSVTSGYVGDVVAVGGSDNTSHTAVSVPFGSNPGLVTDDALILAACGDNSVGGEAVMALSATGIAAQLTNRSYAQSSGGDALRGILHTLTVNGGATAAPTYSYTAANATVVAAVLVRIRGVRATVTGDHKYSSGVGRGLSHGVN